MATEPFNRSLPKGPDVLSALVSNLAVIIQIIAVGSIGLANVLKVGTFFQYQDLVTLANFIILLLSFSFIGLYNFHKSNKSLPIGSSKVGIFKRIWIYIFGESTKDPFSSSSDKRLLNILFISLVFSVLIFFYLTYKRINGEQVLNFEEGMLQLISYIVLLTSSSILIYIWIRDSFDKNNLFTENNFIPNLRGTLIEYGYIKGLVFILHQNIQLDNGNRLLIITTGANKKYFIGSFDGSKIHAELNQDQYEQFLNPRT